MVDVAKIRENPQLFIDLINSGRGNSEKANISRWLELDKQRKELIMQIDELNKKRNQISELGKQGKIEEAREASKQVKADLEVLEPKLKEVEAEWYEILTWIPNVPLKDVPQGKTSDENVEIKAWSPKTGYLPKEQLGIAEESGKYMSAKALHADSDFEPKPHWEIGEKLGMINLEAGAKVSGSRFYYLKGDGALIVYGIFNLLFRKLVHEGFEPMIVPLLVKEKALFGSSQFPGDADQVYKLESKYLEDENSILYLVGSSEPSNFGYYMDTMLSKDELPKKFMAQTACFRSEVGSWGKDVRGIKRTHQFDKLEMNMIVEADLDKAKQMHEYLLSLNEWLLQTLELPYHVINMCMGDLGYYAAAKKYDVEVWLPSQKSYMEVMSDSITTDYQSRRLGIKYKDENGNSKYVYTLNDTGATHRLLIAVIEHYQQSDGTIKVPEALREYVGKKFIGK